MLCIITIPSLTNYLFQFVNLRNRIHTFYHLVCEKPLTLENTRFYIYLWTHVFMCTDLLYILILSNKCSKCQDIGVYKYKSLRFYTYNPMSSQLFWHKKTRALSPCFIYLTKEIFFDIFKIFV